MKAETVNSNSPEDGLLRRLVKAPRQGESVAAVSVDELARAISAQLPVVVAALERLKSRGLVEDRGLLGVAINPHGLGFLQSPEGLLSGDPCPKCGTGRVMLKLRRRDKQKFWGCTEWSNTKCGWSAIYAPRSQ
ncbi:MAG: hypothetical protein Q8L14_21925 [Myxococcales bacterium]|nr:hypothetical protein [Myxococcales bacterium]